MLALFRRKRAALKKDVVECGWNDGIFTLHLGDATYGDWQAQFPPNANITVSNIIIGGQLVTSGVAEISTSGLAKGIYILSVKDMKGNVAVFKVARYFSNNFQEKILLYFYFLVTE